MRYPTGSERLDKLFGGYETSILTEFFGGTGTGKTTLAAYVPIKQIYLKHRPLAENQKFIIIDGDGGFDYDRARQVWGDDYEPIVEHLIRYEPVEFSDQHKYITEKLPKFLKERNIRPLLVSADSMTAIYRGQVSRAPAKYKAAIIGELTGKLDLQLVRLRAIAVEYNCPAIVTTWTSSPVGQSLGARSELPMIGGRAFGFLAKCVVRLDIEEKVDTSGNVVYKRTATLVKHRSRPVGISTEFEIVNSGVK